MEREVNAAKLDEAPDIAVCETADGKHGISILQRMQNNETSDVLLFGKDSTAAPGIEGHKTILGLASPHLRDVLESQGFIDSGAAQCYIEDIDHRSLRAIVDFVYSTTLRLTGQNIGEQLKLVLVGADYLLMPDLVQLCGKCLEDSAYLNIGCGISTWQFARKHRCKVLDDAAVRVIASDLCAIAIQDDYLSLSKENVVALLQLLVPASAAPDLVCEAAIAWLGTKEAERKASCDVVMRQVPLCSVSADVLRRASEKGCLSDHVLWTAEQLQKVRAEVDKLELENLSLTTDLTAFKAELVEVKIVAEKRREGLYKMHDQASSLDAELVAYADRFGLKHWQDTWIADNKKDRAIQRKEAREYMYEPVYSLNKNY